MWKITKVKTKGSEKMLTNTKKLFKKGKSSHEVKFKLKKNIKNNQLQHSFSKKKEITSIIRNKHQIRPMSSLIDTVRLDMDTLNKGKQIQKQGAGEVTTKKNFPQTIEGQENERAELKEKTTQEQEAGQVTIKKPFPRTIESLVKELAELRGTPMTREKKLRRKKLRIKIGKKRRKEERRLKRAAIKLAKKQKRTITGLSHTDSNVVSSRVGTAKMDMKENDKNKTGTVHSEMILSRSSNLPKMSNFNKNKCSRRNPKSSVKCDVNKNSSFKASPTNKGKNTERILEKTEVRTKSNLKPTTNQGPVFRKSNKIVSGKIYLPQNHKEFTKMSSEKESIKNLAKSKRGDKI